MSGNARGPSTAFNLIFRLGQVGERDCVLVWDGVLMRGLQQLGRGILCCRRRNPAAAAAAGDAAWAPRKPRFTLLYAYPNFFLQIKPDVRQVRQMLDHRDSPYIRAVSWPKRRCHRAICSREEAAKCVAP